MNKPLRRHIPTFPPDARCVVCGVGLEKEILDWAYIENTETGEVTWLHKDCLDKVGTA